MDIKIGALLPFHNEMRFLPGWFESVAPHVDAIIALDDRSTDGSGEYVASRPETASFQRIDRAQGENTWNEPRNRQMLISAGQKLGCDWFVAFDADERVELNFWPNAREIAATARSQAIHAFQFRLRELWDSPRFYRIDGIWGRKRKAAFFSNLGAAHRHDSAAWHGEWVSADTIDTDSIRPFDYNLYHLRMIQAADRQRRRDR